MGLLAAVWFGSGANLPQGCAGLFFIATVVCGVRRRGACMRFVGTVRFMRGVWGRLGIPQGFAWALFGLARAIDVPMGYAGFFYGNGGVRAAAWRLCLTCLTCLTNWGATV